MLPPAVEDPEQARRYFASLRELRGANLHRVNSPGMLADLSMGMSHDFAVAIEEGATMVRVGSAIFGERSFRGQMGV
jgi:PLP dependent protein